MSTAKERYDITGATEEAEEMYKEGLNRIGDMSETVVMEMDKMYSALQEFKSEIARGKK
jgi:hypothetical protein